MEPVNWFFLNSYKKQCHPREGGDLLTLTRCQECLCRVIAKTMEIPAFAGITLPSIQVDFLAFCSGHFYRGKLTALFKKRYDSKVMKKFFKWLLILLVALTLCVVIVLYNPRLIKGPVERYLSDVAGYQISLNGELEIETGRLIEVSARNVHISGPDWATQEDLIAIGRLNLVLNTASVFKDIVLLELVHIDDLKFNLETDEEGKGNWITAYKPSPPSESDGDGAIVVFNDIQIRNAAIRVRNGKTDVENVFTIDSLSHQQQADGMLHTTLNGDLNNRLVEYTHTVGPYTNILDGRDISYKATGHFLSLIHISEPTRLQV